MGQGIPENVAGDTRLDVYLNQLPLVAILRGIGPDEVDAIADSLVDEGFCIIEVPLNSPNAVQSIERLSRRLGARALIGAGTVLTPRAVDEVRTAGGQLIVMPHADEAVIRAAKAQGLLCVPGVATPTEAFAALQAGADALKLFPAEQISPQILKAWRAVLPSELAMLPVGGITPATMAEYVQAGACGFGLGSGLYRPGMSAEAVRRQAAEYVRAWRALR